MANRITKKLISTAFGLLAVSSASAATNLVVIGNPSTQSAHGHFFNRYGLPWQVQLLPLFILMVGIFHLFYPRTCWWFKWGWRFADSEPSELWLFCERAGGVIAIGFAIFICLAVNGIVTLPK